MDESSRYLPVNWFADDGVPIRNLNIDRIKITERGIAVIERHLTRFGSHPHNEAMLVRLRRISRSEIEATAWDLRFYAHELREFVRMRIRGVAPGEFLKLKVVDARRVYERAHDLALKDYDIPRGTEEVMLYHPFARQFLGYPW